jgi:hypothetical protein
MNRNCRGVVVILGRDVLRLRRNNGHYNSALSTGVQHWAKVSRPAIT